MSENSTSEDLFFPFYHEFAGLQLTMENRTTKAESKYMKNTYFSTAF